MEWLLLAVVGTFTGVCASRTHPAVNPGVLLAIAAGALGGIVAAPLLSATLTGMLYDSRMAGATAAAAIGGMVVTMVAGAARHRLLPKPA